VWLLRVLLLRVVPLLVSAMSQSDMPARLVRLPEQLHTAIEMLELHGIGTRRLQCNHQLSELLIAHLPRLCQCVPWMQRARFGVEMLADDAREN
jgi:hypothetical protein